MQKNYSNRFSSFFKKNKTVTDPSPSLPPACQTLARYYRVLPSNKHGHALILENQHTHVTFFDTNAFTRARTLMQSFFVTLFSVLQRITQQIQREFDRSFNLFSFLSVVLGFKGLLCDASEKNGTFVVGWGQIIAGKR